MRLRVTLVSAWEPTQNEVKKAEFKKNVGLSGARETETGVRACCGSRNLKDRVSKRRKLCKGGF